MAEVQTPLPDIVQEVAQHVTSPIPAPPKPDLYRPPQSAPATKTSFSIPDLLTMNPGFSSRRPLASPTADGGRKFSLESGGKIGLGLLSPTLANTYRPTGPLTAIPYSRIPPTPRTARRMSEDAKPAGRAATIAHARGISIAAVMSGSGGKGLGSAGLESGGRFSPLMSGGRKASVVIGVGGGEVVSPGLRSGDRKEFMEVVEEVKGVARTDIILCKFYHTPGLTCTSRPCRFVHELPPSASTSPTVSSRRGTGTGTGEGFVRADAAGLWEEAIEELIEVFPMSGGGGGAKGRHSSAKYKTIACKDFAAGSCLYGEYCSFIHEKPSDPVKTEDPTTTTDDESSSTKASSAPADLTTHVPGDLSPIVEDSSTTPPSSSAPAQMRKLSTKFTRGPITVPDYKWGDLKSAKLDWTVEPSPRTVLPPPQWATAPPASVWGKGPPQVKGSLEAGKAEMGLTPHLPITAYTFDTNSLPPTPLNRTEISPTRAEYPTLTESQASGYSDNHPKSRSMSVLPAPFLPPVPNIHDSALIFPWTPAPEAIWQTGYTSGWNSMLEAQKMQQQVRELSVELKPLKGPSYVPNGEAMGWPQAEQSVMNYRQRPCKFFAQDGQCPHGHNCSYLHEAGKILPHLQGPKPPIMQNNPLFRTEPCKFFNSATGCVHGDACPFLHELVVPLGAPLMLRPRPWRTKPCRHFQRGTCTMGELCHFAHVFHTKPPTPATSGSEDGGNGTSTKPHPTRARPRESNTPCKRFMSGGGCKYGEQCYFSHNIREADMEKMMMKKLALGLEAPLELAEVPEGKGERRASVVSSDAGSEDLIVNAGGVATVILSAPSQSSNSPPISPK